MIIRGGENISPEEVEDVIYSHPKVDEVAVIAVEDFEWGQEPRAVVVLKKGHTATEDEILKFCSSDTIRNFEIPTRGNPDCM